MAVASITVTEERSKVVAFTVAYKFFTEKMLMKKVTREEHHYLRFAHPFAKEVWLMLLVSLLVATISIFAINYYSPYGYKNQEGVGTSEEFSFSNSLWFSVACMLQQGGENNPRSHSGMVNVTTDDVIITSHPICVLNLRFQLFDKK